MGKDKESGVKHKQKLDKSLSIEHDSDTANDFTSKKSYHNKQLNSLENKLKKLGIVKV